MKTLIKHRTGDSIRLSCLLLRVLCDTVVHNLRSRWTRRLLTIGLCAVGIFCHSTAQAQIRLKNICRIKGQEENTLHGMGLVVGLRGSGDGGGFLPAMRSLAMAMELMGSQIGKGGAAELKDARNVALVSVTTTVPAAGARQGDKIDCMVSSIGAAKSLEGGRLFITAMMGPQAEGTRIYAFCEGALHLDDTKFPTTARIHDGCRLEEDFLNVFVKNNKITLVLDEHHADFEVAQEVAELINSTWYNTAQREPSPHRPPGKLVSLQTRPVAKALNQLYVEVEIPSVYQREPVEFVSQVMSLTIAEPQTAARVVINERAGTIVISADVEIGSIVVAHKNIVVETGDNLPAERFVAVDPGELQTAKLKALVAALNAVKVPNTDIIQIIKDIEHNGKLHGQLIVE
ncbi:MAG TPA: flagellar basal body P-ring protein FlgI [Pirellulales bacterium]|jgi:flagellar P-ring protein precursor FlgI|nr:flagellar basal body P-ring protein FlgI [Pirellulales bacterium]